MKHERKFHWRNHGSPNTVDGFAYGPDLVTVAWVIGTCLTTEDVLVVVTDPSTGNSKTVFPPLE